MGRKKILEKRLARLQKKKSDLTAKAMASQDVSEVRNINGLLEDVNAEIAETQEEIDEIEESSTENDSPAEPAENQRQQIPKNSEIRGGNPIASYSVGSGTDNQKNSGGYASMEYRMAFKDYVQRGTPIPADVIARAGGDKGTTSTADLGAIIPETIMNEFISEVSKVYGQIYSKVRKLNVSGGIKFPISKLKANFKWITESTVSDNQKAGEIKDFVTFEYNIGEIRVSQTLLAQVVSLPLFESEITRIMVEAYVEMMDKVIISGTGSGQPLGITKDPRITGNTSNIIEMTDAEFSDWTAWRKKLFAKIPLSKRGQGEFLFPASTVESYLLTMKDANNRPLFREATDLSIGNTAGSFFGRSVTLVEPDVIPDFDTALKGDVVGIFWVPNDYAINTNMQFGIKCWFDNDKNELINQGLTIVDGKMLDTSGCYLIKRK
ncbi:MAG: phage major capsid protein [Ruminococcus sp.]|nr:phage major capsid protein [Ruminococcus sp.]